MAEKRLINNKWLLVGQIGRGGMGTVYEVEHKDLGVTRALKQLHPHLADNPEVRRRFLDEAQMEARLHHPNIVQVFDIDTDPEFGTYLVMELIKGDDLGKIIGLRGRLSYGEVLRIGAQIAAALDHAHSAKPRPIIHRDIKPANVLIEDGTERAVVTDFGIAKQARAESEQALTHTGHFVGTFRYSAPEQIRNDRTLPIDGRADIYSLGVVLYEMFSGERFLRAMSEMEILNNVAFRTDWQPELEFQEPPPEEFRQLILRCLARNREDRPPTGAALKQCLEQCIRDTGAAGRGAETVVGRPAAPAPEPPLTASSLPTQAASQTTVTIAPEHPQPEPIQPETIQPKTIQPETLLTPTEDSTAAAIRVAAEAEAQRYAALIQSVRSELETRASALRKLQRESVKFNVMPEGPRVLTDLSERLQDVAELEHTDQLPSALASLEALNDRIGQAYQGLLEALRAVVTQTLAALETEWERTSTQLGEFLHPDDRMTFQRLCAAGRDYLSAHDWEGCWDRLSQARARLTESVDSARKRARVTTGELLARATAVSGELSEWVPAGRAAPVDVEALHSEVAADLSNGRLADAKRRAQEGVAAIERALEQQRRETMQRLDEARQRARELDVAFDTDAVERWAAEEFRRARQAAAEAAAAEQGGNVRAAIAAYDDAAAAYRAAREHLVHAQATHLAELRQEVEALLGRARAAPAEAVAAVRAAADALLARPPAEDPGAAIPSFEDTRAALAAALDQVPIWTEAQQRREDAQAAARRIAELGATPAQSAAAMRLLEGAETARASQQWAGARDGYGQALRALSALERELRQAREQEAAAAAEARMRERLQVLDCDTAQAVVPAQLNQARKIEQQARAAQRRREWTAAAAAYDEAGAAYAVIHEHVTQLLAARRAGTEMQAARTAAIDADAEQFAAALLREARSKDTQAEAALAAAEFAAAADLFAAAARGYARAAGEAQQAQLRQRELAEAEAREQERRRAEDARTRAQAAREGATMADAAALAHAVFEQALAQEEQAVAALRGDDHTHARELFEHVAQLFARAAAEAAAARVLRDAQQARDLMRARRGEAEREGAANTAEPPYGRALSLEAQAEERWNRQAFDEARQGYLEAGRLYAEARERAHVAALRGAAERGRAEMQSARTAALEAKAEQFASAVFGEAGGQAARAEAALADADFAAAQELFAAAVQGYARACRDAQQEQLRQRESAARAEAREALTAATQAHAGRLAAVGYKQGTQLEKEAERAARAQAHETAINGFVQAAAVLQQAARDALAAQERELAEAQEREQQRRQAEEGRTNAHAARAAAERADVRTYATELYAQGRTAFDAAERSYRAAKLLAAREEYDRATAFFGEAIERAERKRERHSVDAVQAAAAQARQEAQQCADHEHCAQQLAIAEAKHAEAARDLANGDLTAARETFEESATLFRAATQEAARYAQTEQARHAQAHAHDLQQHVRASGFSARRRQRRSLRALRAGDRYLEDAHPAEALMQYEKAVGVLNKLARASAQEESTRPVRIPSSAWFGGLLAATVALVLLVFHFINVKQPPAKLEQHPTVAPQPIAPPPLAWHEVSPAAAEQQIKEGEHLAFAVSAGDPQERGAIQYVWLLDGREQARGANWDYQPGFDEGGRTKEVKVIASSGDRKIEQSWRVDVRVQNRPPAIASLSPTSDTVSLAVGGTQKFAVTASDPDTTRGDTLTYTWERNGHVVASGAEAAWTLQDAKNDDTEVGVTVTDAAGATAGPRTWKVAVAKPPPPILPPRIVSERPPHAKVVTVEETGKVDFGVRAENPNSNEPLAYAWFLDGREVGRGSSWEFTAPAATNTATSHKVEVEVSDRAGRKAPRVAWGVDVRGVPPKVVDFWPRQRKLSVDAGQSKEFGVNVSARSDLAGVHHEWSIDGVVTQKTREGRFDLPTTLGSGTHDIAVAAIDTRGLRSALQRWSVEIKTRPIKIPTPVKPAPAEAVQLSEAEVRKWLVRFQDAWQRKDVGALRALGVITTDREEVALKRVLDNYRQLRVSIRNETIHVDGRSATVSFDRIDTDETGKALSLPRQTYHLEKDAGGVVTAAGPRS